MCHLSVYERDSWANLVTIISPLTRGVVKIPDSTRQTLNYVHVLYKSLSLTLTFDHALLLQTHTRHF